MIGVIMFVALWVYLVVTCVYFAVKTVKLKKRLNECAVDFENALRERNAALMEKSHTIQCLMDEIEDLKRKAKEYDIGGGG